jgi:hypothetical protein
MLIRKRLFSTLLFSAALSFNALAQDAEPDLMVHDLGILTDEVVGHALRKSEGVMQKHRANAALNARLKGRLREYSGMPIESDSYIKHYRASYGGAGKTINIESDVIHYLGMSVPRTLQLSSNVKVDLLTYMDSNMQICHQYIAQVSPLVVNSKIVELSYSKATLCGTPMLKENDEFSIVGLEQIVVDKVLVTPSEWMSFERPEITLK